MFKNLGHSTAEIPLLLDPCNVLEVINAGRLRGENNRYVEIDVTEMFFIDSAYVRSVFATTICEEF